MEEKLDDYPGIELEKKYLAYPKLQNSTMIIYSRDLTRDSAGNSHTIRYKYILIDEYLAGLTKIQHTMDL